MDALIYETEGVISPCQERLFALNIPAPGTTGREARLPEGRNPAKRSTQLTAYSFMIEGLGNDDGWRMVEDEFSTVAGVFTAHLHAAEYQRLKKLARSQNEETIRHISRPVTGEMTDLVRRRHLALGQASKQRKGLKRALASVKGEADDDDDTPWAGTSLQGLMDSPRKRSIPLTSVTSVVSGTRAAAGYRQGSPTRGSGTARAKMFASYASIPRGKSGRNLRRDAEDAETEDDDDGDLDLDRPLPGEPLRRITSTPASAPKSSPTISPSIRRKPSYSWSKPAPHKKEAVGESNEDPDASMFVRRGRR